jgi:hypothetical protein
VADPLIRQGFTFPSDAAAVGDASRTLSADTYHALGLGQQP